MKLINQTSWRTDDLRALIAAALEADGIGAQGMDVTVRPSGRSDSCSGCAWLKSRRMILRVPTGETRYSATQIRTFRPASWGEPTAALHPTWDEQRQGWVIDGHRQTRTRVKWDVLPEKLRDDLARVAIHEAAHCRGVDHSDMHGNLKRDGRGGTDDRDVSFAATLQVRAKPVKVKAPVDHVARRAAHAAAKLSEAERRLKLARTIAAKWRAKVRYYERRAAAQGTVQP